jgi:glucokinase
MGLTIGVDIGGTKVAAGVVDEAGRILTHDRRATPAKGAAAAIDTVMDLVRELASGHEVEAVGLGAPGFVDAGRSTVLFTPNLAWRDEPLREIVEKRCGLPAVVENDANAAAWAEARFGAGRGEPFVVLLTIGTGIGGGLVLDGRLYRGRFGVAAEIGHLNVVPGGRLCGCGNKGCWEQYASGRALVREAQELARRSPEQARHLLELAGGWPEGIAGQIVTEAAKVGDPTALRCFEVLAEWLGHGMADLGAIIDPGVFVLGGGVSEAGDILLAPTAAEYEARLTGHSHRPLAEVRLAELGPEAGIVGAADLARLR